MNPEKSSLHKSLLQEQGWLCAYTMRRVDEDDSHIEHIKPESLCRSERAGSDLDYDNLVACFPRDGMKPTYRYGAQLKADWWKSDGALFVSPLRPNCENCFRFDIDGNISAVAKDPAALSTIKILRLDHPSLTEDRKRVIHEFIYGESGQEPLSPAKASQAIGSICNLNSVGHFVEFCVAIRYALHEHVSQMRKVAARRRRLGKL